MANFFVQVWQSFLKDSIDILLVALLIYRLMLLMRGTRSVQILQGILLLAIVTFIVNDVLHLPMTSWLLEKFWMAGLIILAIVFQPEIRSALAQLGGQPLSRLILSDKFNFIDEIIAAMKECSERRIGALIVLEQETGLKNFIETGTRINAEISRELLLSVLHPRSPLHDGAIIISAAQLVAAGCVLPLTDDPHFAKLLGTRHRAAVGLSECSDAVILVVSEENGKLSIARDTRLQTGVDIEVLRDQLNDLFQSKTGRSLLRKAGARPEG